MELALADDAADTGCEERGKKSRHPGGRCRARRSNYLAWLRRRRTDGIQNFVFKGDGRRLPGFERTGQASGAGVAQREDAAGQLDRIAGAQAIEVGVGDAFAEVQLND